ncbi:MAG: UDP-N-acetylmuramoyl-L-alanine--D-glutamate ligase [Betaproteobacteria bacterium]
MATLRHTSVLILGLGASGLAMARWCARAGARVTVADTRADPPQRARLAEEWPQSRFVHAALDAAMLTLVQPALVLKSPGLSPAQVAPLLVAARGAGIPVWGELDLFSQALAELRESLDYTPEILAVTGTNGKTTVVSLTGQLIERAGKTVALAGNIGPTLLDTLAARLDGDDLPQVWVLELSSFQLADMAAPALADHAVAAVPFEPSAACVLNLTQDHLDWHGDMAAYAQAKARAFGTQGLMVLNRDDPQVMAMLPAPVKGQPMRRWTTVGAGLPDAPGTFGLEQVHGMVWLVRAQELDPTVRRRKGQDAEPLQLQRLMPAEALRIRGRHNAVNALTALALAAAAGCTLAPLLYGLREYRGEPHRVESIGIVGEVEFFDDSKGTNVGATAAALAGLGAERKLVPILGGEGKGQDFSPLAEPIATAARAVVLIGRDAPLIRSALASCGVPLLDARDMHHAVNLAMRQAHGGDAVLLSPACASFDMFDNYEHRAQVFLEAVQALALDAGASLQGVA